MSAVTPIADKLLQCRDCPLCAIRVIRCDAKERPPARRSLRNPIRCFDQAAAAAAFRFLRQPSIPNAPRPLTKSGRAAGNGVVAVLMVIDWMSACAEIVPILAQSPISTPDS